MQSHTPPWYALARHDLGIAEIEGKAHNPAVLAYFAEAGHPNVRNDETAWCSAAQCTWLERAGFTSPKSLWARDFMKWGRAVKVPYPGCIAVFARGTGGHVGNFVRYSADRKKVLVLGGNQSNRVCEQWYPVNDGYYKLLGFREPQTWNLPNASPVIPSQPTPVYPYETPDDWQTVVEELRKDGSRTIEATDRAEMKAKGLQTGGIVATFLSLLYTVLNQAAPLLPMIGITAFGLLVIALAAWTLRDQIAVKKARADDHASGRHRGRGNVIESSTVGYTDQAVAVSAGGADREYVGTPGPDGG